MANSSLPLRPSLEFLRKLAKDRLEELRQTDPQAKLAAALLAVAREHGFPSWRALKAEVEQRQNQTGLEFFQACSKGDTVQMRALLELDPALVRAASPDAPHGNWTGLHEAAKHGHAAAVRLLLEHGADANAREVGDNTYAVHSAAASGYLEVVRELLDAGRDANGFGDVHELDLIGWATVFRPQGDIAADVVALLLERGARHHIFSAMAVGDPDLIQQVVEQDPEALERRMSRFEQKQTPLHFAIGRKRYDLLELLIQLGADLEAQDNGGQTALAAAMVRGDRQAISRLEAAGAQPPKRLDRSGNRLGMAGLADSVKKGVPMIDVPDVARTLEWYKSIGFRELGRYPDEEPNWGMLSFGQAEVMLREGDTKGSHEVSLWFYTGQIARLYELYTARQLESAQARVAGEPASPEPVEITEALYEPPYGGMEFGVRDLNGYNLFFLQPSAD